MTTKY